MQSSLVTQGFDLLIFGMGTVFVFLALLVVGITVMSGLIGKFFPEAEPETAAVPNRVSLPRNQGPVEPRILSAIQEAIYQHRAKNQK